MSLTRVVLLSGRAIELSDIQLSSTYAGLLEGYPCARVNDMKINSLLRRAERDTPRSPVHLVEPAREYRPENSPGPFGPVEILPPVSCVASFHSTPVSPTLDPVLHRSTLTVIWFQQTPQVPSGTDADKRLRALEWEDLARDTEL
ncbi:MULTISPECIES: hypothetical protein [unclassified Streptomyces]|uniref:Uncharacterized protein n=1 Tax=Streptomyces niveiscabiei TaxID=164115 RepID=A0ABW9HWZ2_9ACTN|nr:MULTISPECIES: hypothetical protein [unclassified Streptomyces]QZZ28823.1 hypothetical protein A7X85_23490 [Streptomyces sp. ST1015]